MTHDSWSTGIRGGRDGGHEEWLLDDAIDDTFPASDPVALGQPGSSVNLRYAARQRLARRARARRTSGIVAALVVVGALACGLLLADRRRRRDVAPFLRRLRFDPAMAGSRASSRSGFR
jgi:hypothetical protein